MNGDALALVMGGASLIIFLVYAFRIKAVRKAHREALLRDYTREEESDDGR